MWISMIEPGKQVKPEVLWSELRVLLCRVPPGLEARWVVVAEWS